MTDKWACCDGDFRACCSKNKEPSSHLPPKINTASNELCIHLAVSQILHCAHPCFYAFKDFLRYLGYELYVVWAGKPLQANL